MEEQLCLQVEVEYKDDSQNIPYKLLAPTFSLLPDDQRHAGNQILSNKKQPIPRAQVAQRSSHCVKIGIDSSLHDLQHALLRLLPRQHHISRSLMAASSIIRGTMPDGNFRSDIFFALLSDSTPCLLDGSFLIIDPRAVTVEILGHFSALTLDSSHAKLNVTLSETFMGYPLKSQSRLCNSCKTHKSSCRAAYRHPSMRLDNQYLCDAMLSKTTPLREMICCDFCSANPLWQKVQIEQIDWRSERQVIAHQLLKI